MGALLVATVAVSIAIWQLLPDDPQSRERLWQDFRGRGRDLILPLVSFAVAIVAALLQLATQSAAAGERLVVGPAGIEYRSAAPAWLPFATRGWSFAWGRLESAEVSTVLGTQQPLLVLRDGARTRRIAVLVWVGQGGATESLVSLWREGRHRPTLEDMRARVEDSALARALRVHGVALRYPAGVHAFDLMRDARTRAVTFASLALLVYGAVDGALIEEAYVEGFPWVVWLAAGGLAAFGARRWLARPAIPPIVTWALALLFGATAAGALVPGLLRLNQATDADGPQPYRYLLTQYVRLEPQAAGLPVIELHDHHEYSSQFRPGSVHTLHLRRGGLGFYQLHRASLNAAIRVFYAERNARDCAGGARTPAARRG